MLTLKSWFSEITVEPPTYPYAVSTFCAGTAFMLSSYFGLPAAITSGVSVILGIMGHDIVTDVTLRRRLASCAKKISRSLNTLNTDDIGQSLLANISVPNTDHQLDASWLLAFNIIGNALSMGLFAAGVTLQTLADKQQVDDGNVEEILGTVLGGSGILLALGTHFLTTCPLNGRLKSAQEFQARLQEARRVQTEKLQANGFFDQCKQHIQGEINHALDTIIQVAESAGEKVSAASLKEAIVETVTRMRLQ